MFIGTLIVAALSIFFGAREPRSMEPVFKPTVKLHKIVPVVIKSDLEGRV